MISIHLTIQYEPYVDSFKSRKKDYTWFGSMHKQSWI
jgi:hypothetical protein